MCFVKRSFGYALRRGGHDNRGFHIDTVDKDGYRVGNSCDAQGDRVDASGDLAGDIQDGLPGIDKQTTDTNTLPHIPNDSFVFMIHRREINGGGRGMHSQGGCTHDGGGD